jgi:predicted  nucleic acid-binding Zn-ribbon protein
VMHQQDHQTILSMIADARVRKHVEDQQAEIEQLRSDLELRNQTALDRKEIIRDLEAEIERLRAALMEITELGGYQTVDIAQGIALNALSLSVDTNRDSA